MNVIFKGKAAPGKWEFIPLRASSEGPAAYTQRDDNNDVVDNDDDVDNGAR